MQSPLLTSNFKKHINSQCERQSDLNPPVKIRMMPNCRTERIIDPHIW